MPPPAARGATAHEHRAADLIEFFLEYIQEVSWLGLGLGLGFGLRLGLGLALGLGLSS